MLVKSIYFLFFFATTTFLYGQQNNAVIEYINKYKDIAISEMNRSGVPASIKLAQGILESGAGLSDLATEANNHFGIKCHKEWIGPSVTKDDDAANECFRKYEHAHQSFVDHTNFLTSRPRYADLFKLPITDYKGWAYGLKAAGYATNPKYPELLIKRIEDYELHKYDQGFTGLIGLAANNPNPEQAIQPNNIVPQPIQKAGKWYQNGVLVIKTDNEETLLGLANRLNIHPYKLQRLNDFEPDYISKAGDLVYLKAKKKKGPVVSHIVQQTESIAQISQMYGVRKSSLLKYNNLVEGEEPEAGTVIFLKGTNPEKIKKRSFAQIWQLRTQQMVVPKNLPPAGNVNNNELPNNLPSQNGAKAHQMSKTDSLVAPKNADTLPSKQLTEKANQTLKTKSEQEQIRTNSQTQVIDTLSSAVDLQTKKQSAENTVIKEESSVNQTVRKTHIVVTGDTLFNIARKYNISVDELRKYNDITDNTIKLGQTLFVSP